MPGDVDSLGAQDDRGWKYKLVAMPPMSSIDSRLGRLSVHILSTGLEGSGIK